MAKGKEYRRGTHRAISPSQTIARVAPLLPAMGITRLANITGLDKIGIPVFMACRPNSRSLAVFQGKGLDEDSARASAMMEAIETYHAETIDLPLKFASLEELRDSHDIIDPSTLPLSRNGLYDPLDPFYWIEAQSLLDGARFWIPFELVHANFTLPELQGGGAFAATTNGLASGNSLDEAICHGLYELIERDAETLWKLAGERDHAARALDLGSVNDPDCRWLLEKFAASRMRVAAWDVTSDIGIASYVALISGEDKDTGAPEFGAGTHLCPAVALARALTEAAQARTTYIAGSRDDITAAEYALEERMERHGQAKDILDSQVPRRSFFDQKDLSRDSLEEDLEVVLRQLAGVGLDEVLVVDLTKKSLGVPVVRVIVPGLEGAMESEETDYVPGERAYQVLETECWIG